MLALIDGDVLAYQACENRFQKDASGNWTMTKEEKLNKEFTTLEDKIYLQRCWENFQESIVEVCNACFATEYLMAVKLGGIEPHTGLVDGTAMYQNNFRDLMYPGYKANRHKDIRMSNHFVPLIRQLAVLEDIAVESHGREADDLLGIWAEQARQAGDPFVIASIDKDLKTIHGNHYLIHKNELQHFDIHYSTRFFYEQLLKGDPTDNIPGIPRVGDVKATRALSNCRTEDEFQEKVVEMYMDAYGENWFDYLMSNGKMLYLQKHPTDYFTAYNWPIVQIMLNYKPDTVKTPEVVFDAKPAKVVSPGKISLVIPPIVKPVESYVKSIMVPKLKVSL